MFLDSEMAGRHKAQRESLVIVRTTEIKDVAENSKRAYTSQILKDGIKFPLLHKKFRSARKTFRTVFKASRPNLIA